MDNIYTPETDGVNHINIHINARTELGRMLSYFYEIPFTHPYFGPFVSMEGFWHFVQGYTRDPVERVQIKLDELRGLSGQRAKNFGKQLDWYHVESFKEIILAAHFYKIEQNQDVLDLLIASTLPFDTYYVFKPEGDAAGASNRIIHNPGYEWQVQAFEDIRKMLKNGERPVPIDYDSIFSDVVKT